MKNLISHVIAFFTGCLGCWLFIEIQTLREISQQKIIVEDVFIETHLFTNTIKKKQLLT